MLNACALIRRWIIKKITEGFTLIKVKIIETEKGGISIETEEVKWNQIKIVIRKET